MPPTITERDPLAPNIIQADPRLEYASAGAFPWLSGFFGSIDRTLPWPFDDLTYAFGDDIYDRMMWDSQVAANLHVLKAGILNQDPSVSKAVDDADPRAELAQEIADFTQRAFTRLKGLRTHTLYNMLDCLMTGNKIAERVYEPASDEQGKLVIKRLAVKPRRALSFVVDPYMNVLGFRVSITAREPGDTGIITLPPSKCSVMQHAIKDEDPRGTSLGRAVYEPWFGKMQTWSQYIAYLAQFASSSIVGMTPPQSVAVQQLDPSGNPVLDNTGAPVVINPATMMRDALQTLRNGGVAVFPAESKVQPIPPQGDGQPFLLGFRWFDEQITIAMMGQSLATMEGQHESRAASQVHQDSLETRIQMGKTLVEEMLWFLADDLRMRNYPNSEGLTPNISLGDVGPQDMAQMMMAVAALEKAGYIAPSQRAQLDAVMGIPVRTQDETDAQTEQFLNPPVPPPTGTQDTGTQDDMTAAFAQWRAEQMRAVA